MVSPTIVETCEGIDLVSQMFRLPTDHDDDCVVMVMAAAVVGMVV